MGKELNFLPRKYKAIGKESNFLFSLNAQLSPSWGRSQSYPSPQICRKGFVPIMQNLYIPHKWIFIFFLSLSSFFILCLFHCVLFIFFFSISFEVFFFFFSKTWNSSPKEKIYSPAFGGNNRRIDAPGLKSDLICFNFKVYSCFVLKQMWLYQLEQLQQPLGTSGDVQVNWWFASKWSLPYQTLTTTGDKCRCLGQLITCLTTVEDKCRCPDKLMLCLFRDMRLPYCFLLWLVWYCHCYYSKVLAVVTCFN